jgi:hypothetical protein
MKPIIGSKYTGPCVRPSCTAADAPRLEAERATRPLARDSRGWLDCCADMDWRDACAVGGRCEARTGEGVGTTHYDRQKYEGLKNVTYSNGYPYAAAIRKEEE